MAGLLVSVRDADEARAAVAGGAAVVDVKEPARGALGRADAAVWRAVRAVVPAAIPVSVALGELGEGLPPPSVLDLAGIVFVKLGLSGAGGEWRERWRAYREAVGALGGLGHGTRSRPNPWHPAGETAGRVGPDFPRGRLSDSLPPCGGGSGWGVDPRTPPAPRTLRLPPPSWGRVGERGESPWNRGRCADASPSPGREDAATLPHQGGGLRRPLAVDASGASFIPHPLASRATFPSRGEVGTTPTPRDHATTAGYLPSWIAVAYADAALVGAPDPDAVLDAAIEAGCAGILLDTALKGGPSAVAAGDWSGWIARAKAAGLLVALAGGLDAAAIARLAPLGPDLFAVRGAACTRGDRGAAVEAARVAGLVALLT